MSRRVEAIFSLWSFHSEFEAGNLEGEPKTGLTLLLSDEVAAKVTQTGPSVRQTNLISS